MSLSKENISKMDKSIPEWIRNKPEFIKIVERERIHQEIIAEHEQQKIKSIRKFNKVLDELTERNNEKLLKI